ncbi:MAG: hypothetical protein ABEH78_01165 [Haloferacaceae archaeon]
MAPPGVRDRLRQSRYTGENRCIPCTVVNLGIAGVLAVATAAITYGTGPVVAALVGGAAFLVAAVVIYLRGYLVPGTPWLTRTYAPDWLLRPFDKDEMSTPQATTGDIDTEAFLKRAGAVTECPHEDDLCLTDAFQVAWRDRIARLREADTTRAELAAILEVDPERLSFEGFDDAFVARIDGRRAGQWESHAAFLADVAAANALCERSAGWDTLDIQSRSSLLNGLRIFLERCPACDSPVTIGEEVVQSCCRSVGVVAVTCQDCGARIFEAEYPSA